MGFLFEEMRVYKKSMSFATEILQSLEKAPRSRNPVLCDQFRRAVMSIPANLAEGSGRWHIGDRKQFFWVSRGSTNECVTHLQFAVQHGLIRAEDYPRLKGDLDLIGKMITRLIQTQK